MGQMIAIVGRPNVGKSTLFNRLTQTRTAITNDEAGTTRDRQYGKVDWNGKEFSIVDTGGWVVNSEDVFENEINKQVHLAIEQADEILFVVDAMNGVTDLDDKVAQILRRSTKPVILVANKVDAGDSRYNIAEFYSLGLGEPYGVSAVSGYGTGDLLDEVVKKLPEKDEEETAALDDIPKIAIVGRPNAGKSSIINAFIDEDRHIVTDIAGTTRDSIYTRYNKFGFDFYLVDTAGIRKKTKVTDDIEYYSVIRSIRAIEASDVCILMIDGTRGIEAQDVAIFSLIQKNKKGQVVGICYTFLSFSKPDYLIAGYNLANGADYDYLSSLSADAAPAILDPSVNPYLISVEDMLEKTSVDENGYYTYPDYLDYYWMKSYYCKMEDCTKGMGIRDFNFSLYRAGKYVK